MGSTGLVDITIAGFGTPIAAIFDYGLGLADDTQQTTLRASIGFTDGTNQAVSAIGTRNNSATSSTSREHLSGAVVLEINDSGGLVARANFDSFIADGVRINVTNSSANRFCMVTLIGGDATSAKVDFTPQLGTSAGTTNINTIGFEPDLVLTSCIGVTSSTGSGSQTILSEGLAVNDGADFNAMLGVYAQDNINPSNTGQYISNTYAAGQYFADVLAWGGTVNNYSGSGFDVVTNASAGNDVFAYLAVKFNNTFIKAAIEDSPTTTGSKSFGATPSTPNYLRILGSSASSIGTVTSGLNYTVFNADTTEQASFTYSARDNITPTSTGSLSKSSSFKQLDQSGSTQFDSSFTGFTSTGADFNFTTVVGTARKWITLFVCEVSSGIDVNPNAVNSDSVANNPTLQFNVDTNVIGQTANTSSISNNPALQFNTDINITGVTVNSSSIVINPAITVSSNITVNGQTVNSESLSNNPLISITSGVFIAGQTVNTQSISNDPSLQFDLSVTGNTVNTNSASVNPSISFGLVIAGNSVNTDSVSNDPTLQFNIDITGQTTNTLSNSINPAIQIGEITYTLDSATNINALSLSVNINAPILSTNING
jgi:uncharacterized membrane protein YcgQ (UPF0703/DUF1980 family)